MSNVLSSGQFGTSGPAAKVPVCNGCGEAFESRAVANEAHGKQGCGNRDDGDHGYTMTRESEAW